MASEHDSRARPKLSSTSPSDWTASRSSWQYWPSCAEHEEMEAQPRLEERLERLLRERDQMGPVNLRAEIEMEELAGRISEMETEKEDLHAAISKLRSAIQQLNREGRARLLESFKQVNSYFSEVVLHLVWGRPC